MQDQLQRESALNILIYAIIVWNTVYLGKATELLRNKGVTRSFIKTYFSIRMGAYNLLGEYRSDQMGATVTTYRVKTGYFFKKFSLT